MAASTDDTAIDACTLVQIVPVPEWLAAMLERIPDDEPTDHCRIMGQ